MTGELNCDALHTGLMRPTRRYWAAFGLTVLLAASAWLFDRPALLAGVAALGGWLVASAYVFYLTVTDVDEQLELEVSAPNSRVPVDAGAELALEGAPVDSSGTVTVRLRLPAGLSTTAHEETRTIRLVGAVPTETAVAVETPVAGRFALPEPEVIVTGSAGLFVERFECGPTPTLTVDARRPDDLSVSAGQEPVVSLESQRSNERRGEGIDPAELRKYVPGEKAARIDWKATARLGDTYVREFETESAVETAFVVDARSTTDTGPEGETEFDYLREAALGLLAMSRSYEDPVGVAVVDDDGLAALRAPTNAPAGYDAVRQQLLGLAPGDGPVRPSRRLDSRSSLAGRLLAAEGEESAFVETLSACLEDRRPLPPDASPLRSAVGALGKNTDGRMVVLTDDTDRRETREAVETARSAARGVTVFLAPTVLYEPGSLADLPAAYERYSEFETFRRELDRLADVDAYEVGPGRRSDRLRKAGPPRSARQ